MAVIYHIQPQQFATSDNPLVFIFSSDQQAQPNFSFIIRTRIDGALVSTDRVFPQGVRTSWDASPIVKTRIESQPLIFSPIIFGLRNFSTISIEVVENYGNPPINQLVQLSSLIRVVKSSLSDAKWVDYVSSNVFYTNAPQNRFQIFGDQYISNDIMCDGVVTPTFRFYDETNTLINTYATTPANVVVARINHNRSLLVAGGVANYDLASYYTLTVAGAVLRFDIIKEICNEVFYLHWLNDFGAYESFPFYHANNIEVMIKSNEYRKQFGTFTGLIYNFDLNDSGNITFQKDMTTEGELVTELLDFTTYNWLNSILESPAVLIANSDYSVVQKVVVTNKKYKKLDPRFDDPDSFVVNYNIPTGNKSLLL